MEERYGMPGGADRTENAEWMRRMEEANERQLRYAEKQYLMSKISAICSVCVLLIVIVGALILMPRLLGTFRQVDSAMDEMKIVLANLEETSSALAEADMAGMLEGVNRLVEDSQAGVTEAMEKISALDIDTMNEAIADLKAVVEPLARLFKR